MDWLISVDHQFRQLVCIEIKVLRHVYVRQTIQIWTKKAIEINLILTNHTHRNKTKQNRKKNFKKEEKQTIANAKIWKTKTRKKMKEFHTPQTKFHVRQATSAKTTTITTTKQQHWKQQKTREKENLYKQADTRRKRSNSIQKQMKEDATRNRFTRKIKLRNLVLLNPLWLWASFSAQIERMRNKVQIVNYSHWIIKQGKAFQKNINHQIEFKQKIICKKISNRFCLAWFRHIVRWHRIT